MRIHYDPFADAGVRARPYADVLPCGTVIPRDDDGEYWANSTGNKDAVDCQRCIRRINRLARARRHVYVVSWRTRHWEAAC